MQGNIPMGQAGMMQQMVPFMGNGGNEMQMANFQTMQTPQVGFSQAAATNMVAMTSENILAVVSFNEKMAALRGAKLSPFQDIELPPPFYGRASYPHKPMVDQATGMTVFIPDEEILYSVSGAPGVLAIRTNENDKHVGRSQEVLVYCGFSIITKQCILCKTRLKAIARSKL